MSFFTAYTLVLLIGHKMNGIVSNYLEAEAKRFGIYMINFSLDNKFITNLDDDLFVVVKNKDDEIQMVDFNTKKVNVILENITKQIQQELVRLENGKIDDLVMADTFKGLRYKGIRQGVVLELPMGLLLNNIFLANNGPVIPVKLNFIGDVLVNLKTKINNYGINNTSMEISAHIEINEKITMPLSTKTITVKNDIPLAIKIIEGKIPNFYQSQIQTDSKLFTLPID